MATRTRWPSSWRRARIARAKSCGGTRPTRRLWIARWSKNGYHTPMVLRLLAVVLFSISAPAQDKSALGARARQYLVELVRLDTTNPPGNETRVARFLKRIADQ